MKTPLILAALLLSSGLAHHAAAQGRAIEGNGFDSGGINVVPKTDPKKAAKKVKTIQFVAVSPKRAWQSSDKKKKPIVGSLLAFEREAKSGKVAIIRDEKVRLLVGKKDFTVPLDKLSADDQTYIRKLEDAARINGQLLEPKEAKKKAGNKKSEHPSPAKTVKDTKPKKK